ncbi:MAG: hypothetical protein AB7F23_07710 [Phycisphaerae bacterium]
MIAKSFQKPNYIFACLLALCAFASSLAAEETSIWDRFETGTGQADASLLDSALPIKAGPLKIGGFFRYNYTYKDWDETYKDDGQLDFDTAAVNVDLQNTGDLIGSFQYRWYKERDNHDYHFLRHAWLGYQLDDDQIQFGINMVPFGILSYASHNWFFQLPYYMGFEADFDLGLKYIKNDGPWTQHFAYYPMDEGNYFGDSRDSSRYAYDVVETSGNWIGEDSDNTERNQFNYRLAYTFDHADGDTTELGVSAQYSQIHNGTTNDDGNHFAVGAHMNGNYGPYNVMLQAIRYEYDLANPTGTDDSYVMMGAYDWPYKVAAKGTLLSAGVSKKLDVEFAGVNGITLYNDYGVLLKDKSSYNTSHQNVTGFSFNIGRFTTYVDLAIGKNHSWIGPGWTDSFASGDDGDWHTRFNVNVGYYF